MGMDMDMDMDTDTDTDTYTDMDMDRDINKKVNRFIASKLNVNKNNRFIASKLRVLMYMIALSLRILKSKGKFVYLSLSISRLLSNLSLCPIKCPGKKIIASL